MAVDGSGCAPEMKRRTGVGLCSFTVAHRDQPRAAADQGIAGSVSAAWEILGTAEGPLARSRPDLRRAEWRGEDLNLRPSGYEPDELPDCSTPRRRRHPTWRTGRSPRRCTDRASASNPTAAGAGTGVATASGPSAEGAAGMPGRPPAGAAAEPERRSHRRRGLPSGRPPLTRAPA